MSSACAQQFSVGALAGGGSLLVEDYPKQTAGFFGAEAGVRWTERSHGFFFDYARWQLNQSYLRSEDIIALGWRWQPEQRPVAPFFGAGLSIVTSRYVPRDLVVTETHAGVSLRAGINVPIGSRIYVRPFVRSDTTPYRLPIGFGVAIGYRF